ncbi:epoxide hydrolase 4-like [Acanthaster planci]|uniref:Epoxide hydrolase 4-like n=1 Tax=Acanthaster planci TaxID=133434 RepID=A0A8B7ZKE3_ACAPL|nr:epoxide hydrolase 4-like [Acanthaster planci]XP_022103785.1 epoxide hydrolase 4-like [Acanthaster planci]XP_022103786.1 epoxide hydrolase 4-like [Acanthaster planci]XP_022103787.1 epoxide hydrolase 4-like [Acanthaster planci]XP_022103788.1 epoxide hydrolase 4-like [Acanthaster planci]
MAPGIISKLIAFAFTLTYALLSASMVLFGIFMKIIKKGPKGVFSCKTRDTRPPCMDNPDLGTHGFLRIKDVRLHYVSAGDETKPLMLMLHGFPECWYSWRYQITEFKKTYRVVAIDQRGYGDSDIPSGVANYSLKKLVEDIKEVVSGLGYNSCTLVAHDWGGLVAWYVAATYPDIVDKLIVMNIPHPRCFTDSVEGGNLKQLLASWYMFFFQLPFLPELNGWINDYGLISGCFLGDGMGLQNKENMSKEDLEAFKYSASRKGSLTGMINYYRAAFRYRVGIKSSMSTPTLIIWGDQDKALTLKLLDGTGKYVQDLTIKIVPGASHWVQQDAPEAVNKHMREFLSGK